MDGIMHWGQTASPQCANLSFTRLNGAQLRGWALQCAIFWQKRDALDS